MTKFTAKGAETFADAFRYITSHSARIVVAGLSPELLDIAKTVPGVRSQLPLASTVEDARASIKLEEITPQRGKARLAGVVPIEGNWRRAVYYADKMAVGENCEIHLVDLIKVPHALPIGTPLPEREAAGQARLEEAKAEVSKTRLKSFAHVERVRSYSAGLVEYANQLKADFAVVSIDSVDRLDPYVQELNAISLLEAATFETSLVKGAPANPTQPAVRPVIPAVGAWEHALEHACRISAGDDAVITVICLITVPRSEPINAPNPDAETVAANCAKEAARIGREYGVRIDPRVERVRDPVLGFLRILNSQGYDLALVGVKRETEDDYHVARTIATTLLEDLPCETIYLKAADQ